MTYRFPVGLLAFTLAYGCAHHYEENITSAATHVDKPVAVAETLPDVRAQKNGRAFPPGVIALTWDDGPDLRTLALAEFLKREHVSATFFVVSEWIDGTSSDPGFGPHVFETGHAKLPLLADLVALGHRVANHTAHHALLGKLDAARTSIELRSAQRAIDPNLRDELRLFRVPGGEWTSNASHTVDADPYLANLVGPIRWDVDAKDWEGSVWCESSQGAHECEHANGHYRVRAAVMAKRYESAIDSAGRGIVLMHDRVGDVGGDYAYDIAQRLIPRLAAKGYVFAAPVLEFVSPRTRWNVSQCSNVRLGDVDGDGRADACVRNGEHVTCAPASSREDGGLARVAFDEGASTTIDVHGNAFELADVNGDGRADVCSGDACALSLIEGGFSAFTMWSHDLGANVHYADVDGDGKSDACALSAHGVSCARSHGSAFEPARVWVGKIPDSASSMTLGDVNGDGRADVCVRTKDGIACAVSTGASFSHFTRWSAEHGTENSDLVLSDLNGDGRADLCTRSGAGIACAFSNGRTFTKSTTWLAASGSAQWPAEWGRMGDVNGDGRSDFCDCDASGVRCALAP